MSGGKNKLYPVVDDLAKKNLLVFKAEMGLRTQDDAVEMILHKLPKWQADEKQLEKLLAEKEPIKE